MAELQLSFLPFPILAFLCGVGVLLSLCYLKKNLYFPLLWKQRDINQHQGKAKRRKNGGRQKGWKACQSEVEEARKVLCLLQSPLGQHHDTIRFRQLLCPDPSCEMCNYATAEVNRLLFPEALEDATPLASTAPGLSQSTNPADSFACRCVPPVPSTSPPPECLSTVIQSKSIFTSLKPIQEDLSPDSPGGLSTHVLANRDTDHSNMSISDIFHWQTYATLSPSDFQKEHIFLHPPETCLGGDSVSKHMEASSHSSLGLNVQALLERHLKKGKTFQILKKKENKQVPLSKQIWSEYQQTSSGNSLQPLDVQNAIVPQTGWNTEDKPEQLHNSQQLSYVKTLEENLQQKYSQLFWGLPSLHSESLVTTLLVSRSSSPTETCFVLFNGICNAPTVKMQHQGSPPLPHFHLLPLLNVDPKHVRQIKPQSQHFTQLQHQPQPQPHFQSRFAILPFSSPTQIRDCGVSLNRPQNESDSNILNENQPLERHVLQKQQDGLQGLVPVLQKAQDATCSRASNLPLVSHLSHAYVPVSIFPGHYYTTSEPQRKVKLYVPTKVIPCTCPHGYRSLAPLKMMVPQCKLTEISQQKGRHAHLQHKFQGQCSKSLSKSELSFPGHFCEGVPQNFQLREDVKRNLGYILEKSPEDSPQRVSECYLVRGLRAASETKSYYVCHSMSQLGNKLLNVSGKDISQNKIKAILRLHLNTKSWQITEGRIPIRVCCSWMAEDNTRSPGSSQTNKETTNSKNTVIGRVYCQITTPELSFLDPNTRKVLEAHIIRFRMSQMWGLPLKVAESIKAYTLREAKTWPLPHLDFSSSATHSSGIVSKAEVLKPLEKSSKTFQENKLRTVSSVPILDCSLPTSSYVSSEGHVVLKTSHANREHKLAENIQKTVLGRQTFQPLTHSTIDRRSQSETVLNNRCSPEVPRKQTGAGHESMYENVSSSDKAEMIQGQKTVEENLKHFPISKAPEQCATELQSCHILTTQELRVSQVINVNMSKEESTLNTKCPSQKVLDPQDSKLSNLRKQLIDELKCKLEIREQRKAQGCSTDMSLTSDSFPSTSSLTPCQSVCSGHMGASKGPHVHIEDRVSTKQRQESWASKNVLQKCQNNNLPPVAKNVGILDSKTKECRSKDSRLWTSNAGKKGHPVEDRKVEDTFLSLPQNEQFPPGSYFKKKKGDFFQWVNSKRKIKEVETPRQKANFTSTSAQEHNPAENTAVFLSCGLPEAHELVTAIEKILEEKMANSHELEALQLSQQK